MKVFSPTEFRSNSSSVFNEVQASGVVLIESKSRPPMVLMTKDEYMLQMSCIAKHAIDSKK